jgi:hypothetical protein
MSKAKEYEFGDPGIFVTFEDSFEVQHLIKNVES